MTPPDGNEGVFRTHGRMSEKAKRGDTRIRDLEKLLVSWLFRWLFAVRALEKLWVFSLFRWLFLAFCWGFDR